MDQAQNGRLIVKSPLYMVTNRQTCHSCGTEIETVAIATTHLDDREWASPPPERNRDVYLLNHVESLPEEIITEIQKRYPQYQSRYSKTARHDYLMTVCPCSAHQGDHYVHGALFNAARYERAKIKVEKLSVEGRWEIDCGYSTSRAYDALIDTANEYPL